MADLIEKELQSFSEPGEVGFVLIILFFSFSINFIFAPLVEFYFYHKQDLNFFREILGDDILQCSWSAR